MFVTRSMKNRDDKSRYHGELSAGLRELLDRKCFFQGFAPQKECRGEAAAWISKDHTPYDRVRDPQIRS